MLKVWHTTPKVARYDKGIARHACVARHDEVVARYTEGVAFLRQPSAATSLNEGGLWCNIYLSGVRHRYDAVISRHNVVVVRHTEGVALSPLHKGRCPTGQRGKHQDFVLLCYATSVTWRATFPMGKVRDGGRFIHLCLTSLVCRGVMSLQGHFFMFRQGSTPEIYRKFEQKFVQNSSRIAHLQ